MAIDEALLAEPISTLRFYRWSEPSVSFGYFGLVAEARAFANGRSLVRRWTGGGIVLHQDDLTYSLIISSADSVFLLSSPRIYRQVHCAIETALRTVGIEASLAEANTPRISDACFANAVAADVIEGNRKIAGAAHRKTRNGLLHQGSIQRAGLGERFRVALCHGLADQIVKAPVSLYLLTTAATLAEEKYGTGQWLCRR